MDLRSRGHAGIAPIRSRSDHRVHSLDESEAIGRGNEVQIDTYCRKGNSLHTLLTLIEHLAPVAF
jgi:hypothetical protein